MSGKDDEENDEEVYYGSPTSGHMLTFEERRDLHKMELVHYFFYFCPSVKNSFLRMVPTNGDPILFGNFHIKLVDHH